VFHQDRREPRRHLPRSKRAGLLPCRSADRSHDSSYTEIFADIVGENVSPAVRNVFRWSPNVIELGRDATMVKVQKSRWWLVDGGRIFEITGTAQRRPGRVDQAMSVTAQRRQTGRSSAELRAIPEHWNLAAYEILASKLHPAPLPFDLAHEEGRAT